MTLRTLKDRETSMERSRGSHMHRAVFASVLAAMVMAGCTFVQPATNLVSQRLTWDSYLNGDDIRSICTAGAPEWYRLVYNADFANQARAYDVVQRPDGGATLFQLVDRGLVIDSVRPEEIFNLGAPRRSQAVLSPPEFDNLVALMAASGVFDPPPVGLRLRAERYYWLITGCHQGAYFLTAFQRPSARFNGLQFVDFIRTRDRTGVPFPNPVRDENPQINRCSASAQQTERSFCFSHTVGEDGLVGLTDLGPPLFP